MDIESKYYCLMTGFSKLPYVRSTELKVIMEKWGHYLLLLQLTHHTWVVYPLIKGTCKLHTCTLHICRRKLSWYTFNNSPQSRMWTQVVCAVGFIHIDNVPVISPNSHSEEAEAQQTCKPSSENHHSVIHGAVQSAVTLKVCAVSLSFFSFSLYPFPTLKDVRCVKALLSPQCSPPWHSRSEDVVSEENWAARNAGIVYFKYENKIKLIKDRYISSSPPVRQALDWSIPSS